MEQKQLNNLVKRRHPEYQGLKPHWDFLEATYKGGREWFKDNIFRYFKEGDGEYDDRVGRAYRFNHTREIVDLVNKYVFRGANEIVRSDAAPVAVKEFWNRATLNGKSISTFMPFLSKKASIFGRVWVVVDNRASEEAMSVADEKKQKSRVYSYIVRPQDVLDYAFDDAGELLWILIREVHRDDDDPFASSGDSNYRYRLWNKNEWFLFDNEGTDDAPKVALASRGEHGLNQVPVFYHDSMGDDEQYSSPSLIGDIAYLDRACANYLSNLDAIIQDQTFSQLAMPAQGLLPGEDDYEKMKEAGTKRIFLYDGESGGAPHFISPDPKQAELIITSIKQIINEIYHSVGVAGERTKQDNSAGIDNSSGVAKAFDFERVNALLVSKGASLERAEAKMVELVLAWSGISNFGGVEYVRYPENYDARGLYEEIDIAYRLEQITTPLKVKQHQLKRVIKKLYPLADEATQKELLKSVDAMEDTLDELGNNTAMFEVKAEGFADRESSSDDDQKSE